MILHDFKCAQGHRFEAGIPAMNADNPACPACGADTTRLLTAVRVGNAASAGTSREEMPTSWTGIGGGHPDAVAQWRDRMVRRTRLEEKYPELGGDRRPVLAHEGIFRGRPLRAGDDIAASVRSIRSAAEPTAESAEAAASTEARASASASSGHGPSDG